MRVEVEREREREREREKGRESEREKWGEIEDLYSRHKITLNCAI